MVTRYDRRMFRGEAYEGDYGRMFPDLRRHNPKGRWWEEEIERLEELGRRMTHDGEGERASSSIPAGYTYLGQFIDHDITFDAGAYLRRRNRTSSRVNVRSPGLELDSLYGHGPEGSPHLYEDWRSGGRYGFFRIGSARYSAPSRNDRELDLPRHVTLVAASSDNGKVHAVVDERSGETALVQPDPSLLLPYGPTPHYRVVGSGWITDAETGRHVRVHQEDLRVDGREALLADPRNDQNIVISQLTLAFLRFHNAVLAKHIEGGDPPGPETFQKARRTVRWHYQWVVVHDFLRRMVGDDLLEECLGRLRRADRHEEPALYVEFSAAAFRFGHAMIRSAYELNDRRSRDGKRVPIFSASPRTEVGDTHDLRSGRRLPPRWSIQWDRFLPFEPDRYPLLPPGGDQLRFAARIAPQLAAPLGDLPDMPSHEAIRRGGRERPMPNLAALDLVRGRSYWLPAGQTIAERGLGLGSEDRPDDVLGRFQGWHRYTPLFLYVLCEAEQAGGSRLGSVGGQIVAENILSLLLADDDSYWNFDPNWTPHLGKDGEFTLSDLIHLSGAPIRESELPFRHPRIREQDAGVTHESRRWSPEIARAATGFP